MAPTPECPMCKADVTLPENPSVSELFSCPDCGGEIEIISLDPLELAEAPAVEHDWGE
jgi:alpha-aminoadipate/glutamate carrier protein LysW